MNINTTNQMLRRKHLLITYCTKCRVVNLCAILYQRAAILAEPKKNHILVPFSKGNNYSKKIKIRLNPTEFCYHSLIRSNSLRGNV